MSKELADVVPVKSITHNHIGCIKEDMSLFDDAIKHYEEALRIFNAKPLQKTIFIVSHEATLYNNLGSVHLKLKNHQKSLDYFYRALAIRMDNFPPDDEEIAKLRNNIGAVYYDMGEYGKSLEYYQQALEIIEKILPTNHVDTVDVYSQIVMLNYDVGDMVKTLEQAIKLMEMLPSLYQRIMSTASETFRTHLLRKICFHMYVIHSIAYRNPGRITAVSLYSLSLQTKDINAEAEFVIRSYNNLERYPEYAEALSMLEKKRSEHLNLILNQPHNKEMIALAQQEVHLAEVSLAPFVREIDFKLHMAKINAGLILDKLPANSALLEYVRFFYRASVSDKVFDSGDRYCVFILHDGNINLHYLETSKCIDTALYRAREKVKAEENADAEFLELHEHLVSPFYETLEGVDHLYIAPDGELFKLPFELLLNKQGKALSDRFKISYLSTGRDLVRPELLNMPITGYNSAAILADPLYSLPDDGKVPKTVKDDENSENKDIVFRQSRDVEGLELFDRLKFAEDEATACDRAFEGEKYKRYQMEAKKSALRELSLETIKPNIIHVVTYGFALEKQNLPEHGLEGTLQSVLTQSQSEDSMMRCGLLFTGVNNWLKLEKKKLLPEYGNGILTAKEVLSLDLRETDLLVLSACQTALGDTRNNGEGIQGLRRAFELAGVHSMICTLWKIDDVASAILMEKFYEGLLINGSEKLDALNEAKKYVREITWEKLIEDHKGTDIGEKIESHFNARINALIAKHNKKNPDWTIEELNKIREIMLKDTRYKHPYYWAGYILQGDTGSKRYCH